MKEKVIIRAARKYEKSTEFGDIVLRAKRVNSAAGIGFLEGAVWMQERMMKEVHEFLTRLNNFHEVMSYTDSHVLETDELIDYFNNYISR